MDDVTATAQAEAGTASSGPSHDRIFLRDHVVAIEIGAYPEERGVTQRVRFNVELDVRRFRAEFADEVESVVSYDLITDAIRDLAGAARMNLLETFAERLAERLLADPRATRAVIRIEKLDRVEGALGVEIERSATGGD